MKSPPVGHYLQPDPKSRELCSVTICFTCGISKEDAIGANLGLCFLPGILGWVETEPEKTMEREYSLHFIKEGHVGKISLHRRNELVGKNVICKRGHGAT